MEIPGGGRPKKAKRKEGKQQDEKGNESEPDENE